ncbi:putative bifunctional diguanylate cyclase/phosphodiesterase [Govanella unica]|uniref:Bifunctional diguanylate cyclase/phosphodiesterase n=1 Tax=Govanella unica TaxID=2975056 RepID=A0A9X3Z7H2_9PROT|nr:bifunctional diguanylate cyclase/phosphodiesterase [Govania unica]MDA5194058.1 bifunctional diguanylate cyclase/phosphodiesterase [Govania unica]
MACRRTEQGGPDRAVVVRGGSAAERREIADALQALAFDVVSSDAPLTVDIQPSDDSLVFAEAIDWQAFADGMLTSGTTSGAAFLLVNLDQFQRLRTMLGHVVTEALVREIADRLQAALLDHPGARFLHMGGDEFALLLPGMTETEAVSQFANSLLQLVTHPYGDVAPQAYVTARIGVVFYPQDATDIESLVQHASAIVHHESRHGRNNVHFYARGAAMRATERFQLEAELHHAIRNGELEVHYQPQLSFTNGKIIGAEALVRWRRPGFGTVPAEVFVALAEDLGLIAELGTWVLTTAAVECRTWQRTGQVPIRVSINISSYQFRRLDMVAVVKTALADTGLDPDCLTLEVTESLVLTDIEQTLVSLKQLRAMGIHVVLDDFGTGYSSLSYLKTLALDGLKLDRSFITGLPDSRGDCAVIEAVLHMARALHLSVTAEGVETEVQRSCLARLGCDFYQGYLASQALPAPEFIKLLSARAA